MTISIRDSHDFSLWDSAKRRAIFFVLQKTKTEPAKAYVGLVDGPADPYPNYSRIGGPIAFRLNENQPFSSQQRELQCCFSQLFQIAKSRHVDEVAIPVHCWFHPVGDDNDLVTWGLAGDELADVVKHALGAASLPVTLVV